MPETQHKTAIVTGASAGIGMATARMLVAAGWQVIGTGRDPARSDAAEAEIRTACAQGGSFTMLRGDFTQMVDVARIAAQIRALAPRIDVLINNAGGVRDRQILSADGLEATFAANHLAPFLLTRTLLPALKAAGAARVIAVSSSAHRYAQPFAWHDIQSLENFTAGEAYCRAKLANILFTRELARRTSADGIIPLAMHPGIVASNFASHGNESMKSHMAASPDLVAPDQPAQTLVWLATSDQAGQTPGGYFHQKAEETPGDLALDDEAAARLWVESEKLLASVGC